MAYDAFISYGHAAGGMLAPALQRGMQRLAKPWNSRRALRVFRDETGLATNPDLWKSIEAALDESEWLVLLASPEAAASEWVNAELTRWLRTKPVERILPVLADGSWEWDARSRDFTAASSAVPTALRGAFAAEPRHLDLRWARDAVDLDLRNSRFRGAVADLAAPIHGVAKDELEGEDIRLHRRARRLARGAVTALALLVVVSVMFGGYAIVQRNRATDNEHRASHIALLADSGRLAAQSQLLPVDQLDLSLLLAVQGRRLVQSDDTEGGLEAVLSRVSPGFQASAPIPPSAGAAGASPDGQVLAIPGTDSVQFVDTRSWQTVRTLGGFRSGVSASTMFSADGARVLAAGDGLVRVWDARTGAPVGPSLDVGPGPVSAAFDPRNDERVFTAGAGRVIHWDLAHPARPVRIGETLTFAQAPTVDTPILQVSRDGRKLAVATLVLHTTTVFDAAVGARRWSGDGVAGPFDATGDHLLLARGANVVIVGSATGTPSGPALAGFHTADPSMLISSDGHYLAASDRIDNAIRVFDLRTRRQIGPPLAVFSGPSFPVAFGPAGRLVAIDATRAVVWKFGDLHSALTTVLPTPDSGPTAAEFTPDGVEVIIVNQVFRIARRRRAADGADLGPFLDRRAAPVRAVALSHDGRTAATSRPDGTGGLFDTASGAPLSILDAHQHAPLKFDWSPTAPLVATASDDLSLVVWDVSDVRNPRLQWRLQTGHATDQFLGASFSPDGSVLVAENQIVGTETFLDPKTGQTERVVRTAIQGSGLAFTPDGATYAANVPGGAIAFFDTASGRALRTFQRPPTNQGFGFDADGRRLIFVVTPQSNISRLEALSGESTTASANTTAIALYDAASFAEIGVPMSLSGTIPFVGGLSPDRKRLVTGTINPPAGTVAIWDLDPTSWMATACRLARRNLTHTEWARYLPDRPYQRTCNQWPTGS